MKKIKQKIVAAAMLLGVAQFSVAQGVSVEGLEDEIRTTAQDVQNRIEADVNICAYAADMFLGQGVPVDALAVASSEDRVAVFQACLDYHVSIYSLVNEMAYQNQAMMMQRMESRAFSDFRLTQDEATITPTDSVKASAAEEKAAATKAADKPAADKPAA